MMGAAGVGVVRYDSSTVWLLGAMSVGHVHTALHA